MINKPFPRITATVRLQRWVGSRSDHLETFKTVEFDATAAVIELPYKRVGEIQDNRDTADEIVRNSCCREFDRHDGPFDVEVEDAIDAFLAALEVDGRQKLTPTCWLRIQADYKASLPASSTLSAPLSDSARGSILRHLVEQKALLWSNEIAETSLITELSRLARDGFRGYEDMTDAELLQEVRGETVSGLGLVLVG